jgi:hypothetical protein
MAPGDHNTIVFGRANVWKTSAIQTASTSSGWTQVATTAIVGGSVSAIGISKSNTDKIYIGTSNGRIHVTTNNGTNWATQLGFPYVTDLWVDFDNDDVCYASFGGSTPDRHVYKTTDGGNNWFTITTNLPNIAVNSIIKKQSSPQMLFVGTDLGVFQSTNDGADWITFNTGFPTVEVYDLKYKEGPNLLLAATHGRGCFTFDISTLVSIQSQSNTPDKFSLSQNYPNPFNPSTLIKYEIPISNFVSLKVYDVLGNEIADLVNAKLNAGSYETEFNATKLSSGVYFYKLSVGEVSEIKSMILVK